MKAVKKCLLFCCVLFLLLQTASIAEATNISVIIDGAPLAMDVAPVLQNDRTLVPFRACAEGMNAQVDYEASTKQVTMTKDGKKVQLFIGSQIAYINGQSYQLDQPAKTINGRTMVPLRFIGEAFDCTVDWVASENRVVITTNSGTSQPDTPQNPTPPSFDGNIPSLESMTNSLLTYYNGKRNAKQMNAMVVSSELSVMAASHSKDMAQNAFLSSTSPTNGTLDTRAKRYQFQSVGENVARIDLSADGSVTACIDQWLNNQTARANLFHPSAYYVGVGIEASPKNTAVLYVTMDILFSDAYFTNQLYATTSSPSVTLQGYSQDSKDKITIYRLSSTNENVYVDKKSIDANVANGKFSVTTDLWQKGSYIMEIGTQTIKIKYQ